ncbi:hypothetical protein O6H91_Y313000 [Diphasiastrum complanatum]|nr:hypothetical protein O6H91_Y313000 [Diphasiastrum complanatum]
MGHTSLYCYYNPRNQPHNQSGGHYQPPRQPFVSQQQHTPYPPRNNQIHIQELPRPPRHQPQQQLALLGPPPRGQQDLGAQKNRHPRVSTHTHLVENSYDQSYHPDTSVLSSSNHQYQTNNSCSCKQAEYSTPQDNPTQLAIQDGYAIATGPKSNRFFICGETGHFMADCKVKNQYHAECPDCVRKHSFKDYSKQPNRILPACHITSEPVRVLTRAQHQQHEHQQNHGQSTDPHGSHLMASTAPKDYPDPKVEQRQYNEF